MAANAELAESVPEIDLADLAERIRSGDAGAETQLLSRFMLGVRVLLRRHAHGAAIAIDDLAQDVLSAVLEQLRKGGIRDAAALPAYIRTSAMHRLHAEQRALQQTAQSHESIDGEDPRLVANGSHPGDELDAARKARQVRELLGSLPVERDREVLRRFYLNEESCEAICAALDIDADHFRRVIHRARTRFREILTKAGLGPDSE
jgi:RNA polymerase sigma-70 factor, ECF subfamily